MPQTLLQRFVQWCYYSKDYAFIRDSKYGIPLLQSLHLTGITLLLATVLVLNLRLLGIGLQRLPLPMLAKQLARWTKVALTAIICTGIPIFLADPTRYAGSSPFRLKMILLLIALLYHFTLFWRVTGQNPEARSKLLNMAVSAASLTLWFSVGWSARAIAFFQ